MEASRGASTNGGAPIVAAKRTALWKTSAAPQRGVDG
jgi:hypothetical protein